MAAQEQQETSSSLVRAGSSDMQQTPLSAFPRTLIRTVADNASVDEHVTNLFEQVSALRARAHWTKADGCRFGRVHPQHNQHLQLQLRAAAAARTRRRGQPRRGGG